jgi:hypothetical protein
MHINLATGMTFRHPRLHTYHNLVAVPMNPAGYNHSGHTLGMTDNLEQLQLYLRQHLRLEWAANSLHNHRMLYHPNRNFRTLKTKANNRTNINKRPQFSNHYVHNGNKTCTYSFHSYSI